MAKKKEEAPTSDTKMPEEAPGLVPNSEPNPETTIVTGDEALSDEPEGEVPMSAPVYEGGNPGGPVPDEDDFDDGVDDDDAPATEQPDEPQVVEDEELAEDDEDEASE